MNEAERITDQLRRSIDGDAWHGPSVFEALKGINSSQAASRPLKNAHTVWEILLHITVWVEQVHKRLRGNDHRKELPPEQDWPPQPGRPDEAAWTALQDSLRKGHRELSDSLARLDDTRLEQPIQEGFSTAYVTLHGLIQHNLYHAGQIAILKKAF